MRDRLNISVRRGADRTTIALTGELDVSSAADLQTTVEQEVGAGYPDLNLDLADLTFIDSSGLSALVAANERCQSAGGKMTVCAPSRQVTKALQITGLDGVFTIQTGE
jgi:anti-sigma B factor antagonist